MSSYMLYEFYWAQSYNKLSELNNTKNIFLLFPFFIISLTDFTYKYMLLLYRLPLQFSQKQMSNCFKLVH